jgi:selenocysteine-specific elongation factor
LTKDEIERGDVLAAESADLQPTYRLDAALEFEDEEAEHGDRVQVHHGTRESAARLAWLGGRFWQVRLEQPLVPAAGDRIVIRRIAPPDTLGGGQVLDAHPRRHGPGRDVLARLERLARGEPAQQIDRTSTSGQANGQGSRPAAPPERLPPSALALEQRLKQAGLEPPLDAELSSEDLTMLRNTGRAIRVSKNLHYHPDVLSGVTERVLRLAEKNGGAVTLAQLRDELNTSRKFAQALLEHLDSEKVTIRRGEAHHVRRRARG